MTTSATASALALVLAGSGCMSLTPQLHPTDVAALEQIEDYEERNQAYNDNAIYRQQDARGVRYVKGTQLGARPRSWQSLDLILRSDRNSAAALPEKKLRAARVLTGFVVASGIVLLGGIAASAREGLDLSRLNGTGAILLGGGVSTLAFGIATGVVWGQARTGYENAVAVYNDSLALRLGIADAEGDYRPPEGVLVDEEGFIILDQKELSVPDLHGKPPPPVESPAAAPAPVTPQPLEGPERPPEPAPSEPAPSEPADEQLDGKPPQPGAPTGRLLGPSRGL
ncbi:MAG: hypothetical protein R6X02_05000 [Enhygromyxa sp.]